MLKNNCPTVTLVPTGAPADPVVAELKQLDLERLSPREALEKLYAWQGKHVAP